MNDSRELYQRARPIIDRILEATREREETLIAEACGTDSVLAAHVRSLVGHREHLSPTDEELDLFNVITVAPSDDEVPEEFGTYKVLRRLGEGGMSVVYLARQQNPERLVAIKVLRGPAIDAKVLQHEAAVLARLRHPGIAHVYEAGIAETPKGRRPFFVMEFVGATAESHTKDSIAEARTLLQYVRAGGAATIGGRLQLVRQVCDAVNFAHGRGVIHRDLKPVNVLVDHLGHPKVIDFGIAKLVASRGHGSDDPWGETIAGTLAYMSPEQLRGDRDFDDVRGDVYALGVIAYQLLSDALPFDGLTGNRRNDLRLLQESRPRPLSARLPSVPRDVEAIVAKAMSRNPADRYPTPADLAEDIERFLAKKPVKARRNTIAYRAGCLLRRRPVLSASTTVAVLLIAAAAFQAYRENAGAKDALRLLVKGLEQVDPISVDGSPATLERMLEAVGEAVDGHTALHGTSAGKLHVLLGSMYSRQDPRRGAAKAVTHYRRAVELYERGYGKTHVETLQAKNNLGMALSKSGDTDAAEALLKGLIVDRERQGDVRGKLVTQGNYATALFRGGRHEEAFREFGEVFNGFVAGGYLYEALAARGWEARLLMEAGLHEYAEETQREILMRSLGQEAYDDLSLAVLDALSKNLMEQKKWNDAMTTLDWLRQMLAASMPEHTLHRVYFRRKCSVLQQLGDREGLAAAVRELEDWETRYGLGR